MPNDTATIVNKVWNYAHVLRDIGLSYLDYVEQITFLLFLKVALCDELEAKLGAAQGVKGGLLDAVVDQVVNGG